MIDLTPPDRSALPDKTAELIDLVESAMGHVPATIDMLCHAPRLVGPFLTWSAAIAQKNGLEPREQEILALRIAHLTGSAFEWDEHAGFARAAGLTDNEIENIRRHPAEGPDADRDRALLDATDELHEHSKLTAETMERLAAHFDMAQITAIPMIVGQYAMLSMFANTFEL